MFWTDLLVGFVFLRIDLLMWTRIDFELFLISENEFRCNFLFIFNAILQHLNCTCETCGYSELECCVWKIKTSTVPELASLFPTAATRGQQNCVILLPRGASGASPVFSVSLCWCACRQLWAAQRGCFVFVTPPSWQRVVGQCQHWAASLESDFGPPASCCGPHNGDIMWGCQGGELKL